MAMIISDLNKRSIILCYIDLYNNNMKRSTVTYWLMSLIGIKKKKM